MGSSQTLYAELFRVVRRAHPRPHIQRIRTWVWISVGMILSHSLQLSQMAQHLPSEAHAAGRVMQIRRWLSNPFVDPVACYRPLIQQVLAHWQGQPVFLVLDSTAVGQGTLQILRMGLSHVYRTLPLSWLVLAGPGLVSIRRAASLLAETQQLLRHAGAVTLLADRGFRDTEWAAFCQKCGWNYLIRLPNNTCIWLPNHEGLRIEELDVPEGEVRCWSHIEVTRFKGLVCNLMVTWTKAEPGHPRELCAVMTNLPPSAERLQEYLKRMHVEEGFRDDKSGCCQLQLSRLRDPERMNHLLLAYALVTLWAHELGQQVFQRKQRKQIDPAARRQLSIFQIGWRTLQRGLSLGQLAPFTLCIRPMRLAVVRVKRRKRRSVS